MTIALVAPLFFAALPTAGAADAPAEHDSERFSVPRAETVDPIKVADPTPAGGLAPLAACPTSGAPQTLTAGVSTIGTDTTSGSTGGSASDCHYIINVPSAMGFRLRAVLATTSDHDVFVKYNTPATASPYFCSAVGTNPTSESCQANLATAGNYYIRVQRWGVASDFTLTVFIEALPPTCSFGTSTATLVDGVARTDSLTADTSAICKYVFYPPAGQDTVQVTLNPTTPADFDIYVKKGAEPTTSVWDCRPFSGGSVAEVCNVANDGSPVYVNVVRFSGSGAFTLTARAFSPCSYGNTDLVLSEGVPATATLSSNTGAACFLKFVVAPGFDIATVRMTPDTGDFDLALRVGARPTTSLHHCISVNDGPLAEVCDVVPGGMTVYAMVLRYSGSGSFSIVAESRSSCGMGPGTHLIGTGTTETTLASVTGANCLFEFPADASADFASIVLAPTAPNDYDLYVKKGSVPTTSSYDCRPYLEGADTESCDSLIDGSDSFFVMVRRFSGTASSTPFALSATNTIIPELGNLAPVSSTVGAGAMQYWKVVVPATNDAGGNISQLAIAIVADPSGEGCSAADSAGGPGSCAATRDADGTACFAAEVADPGTCSEAYAQGDAACAAANEANPGTCSGVPDVLVPASPDADLYVRRAVGLPTTSAYDCRAATAGSTQACAFSAEAKGAVTEAQAQYVATRAAVGPSICPDPAVCEPNPMPSTLTLPGQAGVVSWLGPGKYFIAVHGSTGPADYVITATWA